MPIDLPYIPGLDVAGIVEEVGSNVSRLKVGDVVFAAASSGTYAEYVAVEEDKADTIPTNVSLNEAAALVVPLSTAYTFLVEYGQVKPGQRLLIHGAAGGVGGTMVQMAKVLGAYVIGTASGEGVGRAKSLGADEVIDYKTQDFTNITEKVDLVIDLVGGEAQVKSFSVIKEGGNLLSAVMPPSQELAQMYHVTAQFVTSPPSYKKLEYGKKLVEAGTIKPQIARTMKLEDAAQAQDMVSAGGVNGKIVLEVD